MMRWIIVVVFLLLSLAFLYWMGWTRRQSWRSASGWDRLPETIRQQARGSELAVRQIAGAPDMKWWGHATMEINWAGSRLLIDPIAAARVKIAPRWFSDCIIDTDQPVDLILLTHAHMDHLHNGTLERLPPTRILIPRGSERFLSEGVSARHEVLPLSMGESFQLGGLEVIPVPARHGGWRYPWQRGLFACGYVVRHESEAIYIAGDTAMGEHFKSIGAVYAPRYALLPIGAYSPQWFLQSRHLNPEEAWQAAEMLGVDYLIPYHFGTYRLSLEPMDEPLLRFAKAASNRGAHWWLPTDTVTIR